VKHAGLIRRLFPEAERFNEAIASYIRRGSGSPPASVESCLRSPRFTVLTSPDTNVIGITGLKIDTESRRELWEAEAR
jgi:hypothetical protein